MSEATSASGAPDPPVLARSRWSPRQRARAVRTTQYVVLVGLVVVVVVTADWGTISRQMFNLEVVGQMAGTLPRAFRNTLIYTAGAFAIGLSGGVLLALMKLSSVRPYRWIATVYAEFFRGIPALLVVITVGYAVPLAFGIHMSSVSLKAAVALGLVSAAYSSETIRAGIQAVPRGQVEAARSLGMSHTQTLLTVVIPQAFRIVLPPMTNEFILLTKDTSLVYALGLQPREFELTKLGSESLSSATGGITALFVVGACYLAVTVPLGYVVRRLERSGRKGGDS